MQVYVIYYGGSPKAAYTSLEGAKRLARYYQEQNFSGVRITTPNCVEGVEAIAAAWLANRVAPKRESDLIVNGQIEWDVKEFRRSALASFA